MSPPARINTSIPFRSSRLASPPSPFSPRSPVTITPSAPPRQHIKPSITSWSPQLPPPSRTPMNWLWACHICHRTYRLGVTRRCLDDGHNFCSGTTTIIRRDGKTRTRRHRACASEFDYQGWKIWGVWRRSNSPSSSASIFEDDSSDDDDDETAVKEITYSAVSPLTPGKPSAWFRNQREAPPAKDCWSRCDYPSQCRWGKQFGVETPVVASFAAATPQGADTEMPDAAAPVVAPPTDFDAMLTAEQKAVADTLDGVDDDDDDADPPSPGLQHLADLVTRAARRNSKSGVGASPLGTDVTPDFEDDDEEEVQRWKLVRQSGSRDALRKAYEGLDLEVRKGFGVLAGILRGGAAVLKAENMTEGQKFRRRSSVG